MQIYVENNELQAVNHIVGCVKTCHTVDISSCARHLGT